MKHSSGILVRFIDLGLLLLLAFLSVAELNPTIQVPLPGRSGGRQNAGVARIEFNQDWEASISLTGSRRTLCTAVGIAEISACMKKNSDMRFLLSPIHTASVQQLVTLLDICRDASYSCTIESPQP